MDEHLRAYLREVHAQYFILSLLYSLITGVKKKPKLKEFDLNEREQQVNTFHKAQSQVLILRFQNTITKFYDF